MKFGKEYIRKNLQKTLPGPVSHRKLLPPGRELTVAKEDKNSLKRSSVLLLLFREKEEIFLCLIKRPLHMKLHAGQIALPGGRIEKDETELDTALRETFEEIGISPDQIEILGKLSELYVSVSQFLIHPFVGWIDKRPVFTINQNEVEKLLLFPLLSYKNAFENAEVDTISGKLPVPCIRFEGEIIWGATAMILSEFYDIMD
jgi:8-oxo-dGTP pyrophosphatase MutT (NUDIX family)